ncbi:MAG: MurR/RpiR family transcriptional regulator [Propionibacteriaceae bacterium]|jgi:DNA-binding MurR/RpiR family transcriptional regulator|nr:MurR/RpiR family transcriptional regulator [Propionibacteriaceae bacterium]
MSKRRDDGAGAGGLPLIRLRSALDRLRPSERRVAEQILADPRRAAQWTIAQLAERAGTSTTSVVRLHQRLGYERLQDFRGDLLHEVARQELALEPGAVSGDIDQSDTLADAVAKVVQTETASLSDTADLLDLAALGRAVELVAAARRVELFGLGASAVVAADLEQKLTRIGRTARRWPDSHSAWTAAVTLTSDCVALAISHTGQTRDTVGYLDLARQAGAATIALTNQPDSAIAAGADVVLTTAVRETRFRSGALGSRIAQLMVVDCLFIGVAQASYESSMRALRDTHAAVLRLAPRHP